MSLIGVAGASREPGDGLLITTGERAGGNQLTAIGAPSRSHERAAATTSTEPAAARRLKVNERRALSSLRNVRWPPVPAAAALTGRSNCTRTGSLTETDGHRSLMCATGARSVNRSRCLLPSTHASQPGRRITASTDTRSSGSNCTRGVRRPPRTKSGIVRPLGPNARTRTSVPPNGCTSTRASALASAASVAPDHAHTAVANPSSATATVAKTQGQRRRARRGERRSRDKKGEGADPVATR